MVKRLALVAVLVAVLAPSRSMAGLAGSTGTPATLGAFSQALIEALERTGAPVTEKVQMVRGLAAGREATPLTEGLAVTLLGAAGIHTLTLNPDRTVSGRQALVILNIAVRQGTAALHSSAATAAPDQGAIDACLVLPNHGKCVVCCKALGITASSCAKACFVINKPSGFEPIP